MVNRTIFFWYQIFLFNFFRCLVESSIAVYKPQEPQICFLPELISEDGDIAGTIPRDSNSANNNSTQVKGQNSSWRLPQNGNKIANTYPEGDVPPDDAKVANCFY